MERESFVFHSEYLKDLQDMPADWQEHFTMYIVRYGCFGIEPELSGLERIVWLKIKRRIDSDCATYDKKVRTLKQNARATHKNTSDTTENTSENIEARLNPEETSSDTTENSENIIGTRQDFKETSSGGVSVSEFVNDTVNENVCVSESEFAGATPGDTHGAPELPSEKYSDAIFEIFRGANLPCCGNNRVSFMQRDFAQGIGYLHKKIPNLHSDEVIQACRNYAALSKNPDLYKGYGKHLSFDSLARKEWFKSLLPSDFNESDFLAYGGNESRSAEPAEDGNLTPEQAEMELFSQIRTNNEFIPAIFTHYRNDWISEGCPTGARYMDFQRKKELAPYGQKLKKQFLEKRGG